MLRYQVIIDGWVSSWFLFGDSSSFSSSSSSLYGSMAESEAASRAAERACGAVGSILLELVVFNVVVVDVS